MQNKRRKVEEKSSSSSSNVSSSKPRSLFELFSMPIWKHLVTFFPDIKQLGMHEANIWLCLFECGPAAITKLFVEKFEAKKDSSFDDWFCTINAWSAVKLIQGVHLFAPKQGLKLSFPDVKDLGIDATYCDPRNIPWQIFPSVRSVHVVQNNMTRPLMDDEAVKSMRKLRTIKYYLRPLCSSWKLLEKKDATAERICRRWRPAYQIDMLHIEANCMWCTLDLSRRHQFTIDDMTQHWTGGDVVGHVCNKQGEVRWQACRSSVFKDGKCYYCNMLVMQLAVV